MSEDSGTYALRVFWKAVTASGSAMFVSLALAVVVSRLLGAEGRGFLAALQLWPTVLGGVVTLGLPAAAAYHLRRHARLRASVYAVGLGATLAGSLVAVVVCEPLLASMLPQLSAAQLNEARLYFAGALPVSALFIYLGGCGQTVPSMSLFNAAKVMPVLAQVPVVAALVVADLVSPSAVAFGFLIAQVLAALWLLRSAHAHFGFSLRRPRLVAVALLGYGAGVWASEVLGTITINADKLVISTWLTLSDLGVYSVAFALSRAVSHAPNAIAALIFPRNVGRPAADVVASTARAFRLSFWPMLIVSLPLAALCYPMFGWVFGPDFAIGGAIFPLLVTECLLSTSSWVLAQAFNSLARPGLVVVRQVAGLAAFGLLALALMPTLGIVGAAISALGASLVRLVATLISFPHGLKVPAPRVGWRQDDWHDLRFTVRSLRRRS